MDIWDTSGKSNFQVIRSNYLRNIDGVLLVFDISNRESFQNIKNWYDEVESVNSLNVKKLLVGNKNDKNKAVEREEAENLGIELDCRYYETMVDNINDVHVCFSLLLEEILERSHDDVRFKHIKLKQEKSILYNDNCC